MNTKLTFISKNKNIDEKFLNFEIIELDELGISSLYETKMSSAVMKVRQSTYKTVSKTVSGTNNTTSEVTQPLLSKYVSFVYVFFILFALQHDQK